MICGSNFDVTLKNANITFDQFLTLSPEQQMQYYCSRIRRTLKRLAQPINTRSILHILYKRAETTPLYKIKRTDLIILPSFAGKTYQVYNGKTYLKLTITSAMVGKYIGAFILTKKYVNHNKAQKAKAAKKG